MKRIFIILTVFLLLIGCKKYQSNSEVTSNVIKHKNHKDYIDFKYDKVIAFASVNPMDYYGDDFNKKIDVKKFKDTISKTLNLSQLRRLDYILSGRNNDKIDSVKGVADCFYPRHNIIFIKKEKIINHIAVCFECDQIKSSKSTSPNIEDLEYFFNSIDLKVFYNPLKHKQYYDSIVHINKNKLY